MHVGITYAYNTLTPYPKLNNTATEINDDGTLVGFL